MAGVLESLRPLQALLSQASDPVGLAKRLADLAGDGARGTVIAAELAAEVIDDRLARPTLAYAGVLDQHGAAAPLAAVRLAQLQVVAEMAAGDHWELILTVPDFLRRPLEELVDRHGAAARPRETRAAVEEIASSARYSLTVAAPYLHTDFVESLAPSIERVLTGGGDVTVVTRALALSAPERSTANVAAVRALREAAGRAGRALSVRSWNEPGIGVHFKVVIADDRLAYLGSANLTPGGMAGHAEAGVLLRGRRVRELSRWLSFVAKELGRRSSPG